MNILNYLNLNLIQGLKTSPFNIPNKSIYFVPVFAFLSLLIGFSSGILEYKPIKSDLIIYLPFTLFVMPSFIEEILFRGLLIPLNTSKKDNKTIAFYILISTFFYVIWHPIISIFNPISSIYFCNPFFLCIVMLLGITCGISYVFSKSLWVPILIHWITVLFWVLFFGGRNLILD